MIEGQLIYYVILVDLDKRVNLEIIETRKFKEIVK